VTRREDTTDIVGSSDVFVVAPAFAPGLVDGFGDGLAGTLGVGVADPDGVPFSGDAADRTTYVARLRNGPLDVVTESETNRCFPVASPGIAKTIAVASATQATAVSSGTAVQPELDGAKSLVVVWPAVGEVQAHTETSRDRKLDVGGSVHFFSSAIPCSPGT